MEMFNKYSLEKQLNMPYDEYIKYLIEKYGPVQGNYFTTPACKSKNKKIVRTSEGLNIHHIDENKEILLGEPHVAAYCPYEYQMADRLVYANLLEHLLLHIKISEEFTKKVKTLGSGGAIMIIEQLNDYFGCLPIEPTGWRLNMFNAIRNYYKEYIQILKYIMNSKNDVLISMCKEYDISSGWEKIPYKSIKKDILS